MTPSVNGNANRLLVIDADGDSAELISNCATNIGFDVAVVADLAGILRQMETFEPTVLILDIELPATDGIEVLRTLSTRNVRADIILTGSGDPRVLATTLHLGGSRGLTMASKLAKPLDPRELNAALGQVYRPECSFSTSDIAAGIENDEFVAFYQPKASLQGNDGWIVDGVEALVRWQHPGLGLVMPDEFINQADDAGLIGALTEKVLDQALRSLTEWKRSGLNLNCAINLPPSLVSDLAFPDRITAVVAQHSVEPDKLRFELTELATMQDPTNTMDILTRLRVKGFGLSIDDFGTGYSSITRLYQMPFDEMKIDKSLVMNVPHSREANTIVGSLIELGHTLGLKICAEGVENRAALDLLQVLQCDRCQGFYLSRAIPARDIAAFVANWNGKSLAGRRVAPVRAVV